jgi:hypothetical protein
LAPDDGASARSLYEAVLERQEVSRSKRAAGWVVNIAYGLFERTPDVTPIVDVSRYHYRVIVRERISRRVRA